MSFHNTTKESLRNGKKTLGLFSGFASYDIAELISNIGLDWIVFDTEHGSIKSDSLPGVLAAGSHGSSTPIVRVPSIDPVYTKFALDSGAHGVMFPQVNSLKDATNAVKFCKYPPEGERGVGPRRASLYYLEYGEYMQTANDEILILAQIESRQAIENIDGILSVKGLDGVFVGPADLSASMGYIKSLPKIEEEVHTAIGKVLEASRKHNVVAGMWAGTVEKSQEYLDQGFQFVALGEDLNYFAKIRDDVKKIKK